MPDSITASSHALVREVTASPVQRVQRVLIVANQTADNAALVAELCEPGPRGPFAFGPLGGRQVRLRVSEGPGIQRKHLHRRPA